MIARLTLAGEPRIVEETHHVEIDEMLTRAELEAGDGCSVQLWCDGQVDHEWHQGAEQDPPWKLEFFQDREQMEAHDRWFRQSQPRCNCESDACPHSRRDESCTNAAGRVRMEYVGPVCDECADRIETDGGGQYLHRPEEGGT